MSKRILLLRTLLLSTSVVNKMKNSKDKKARKRAVGTIVGMTALFVMIAFYCGMMCVGYGTLGLYNYIPVMCAGMISILAFMFTFFKTNGYLLAFKEYDMLMSLPLEARTIAADKFLYMYIKSLPWYLSVSVPMLVFYGIYAKPGVISYIIWLVLTFFLPVIPMLAAAFFGFVIAKLTARFKRRNVASTILTFIFVIFCFSLQYIIEAFVKKDNRKELLSDISGQIESIGDLFPPIKWFANGVRDLDVLDIVLLIVASVVLFEVLFLVVGSFYRQINSSMKTHVAAKEYKMTHQKKHSVVNAIAFKEFKRLVGTQVYFINAALGEILALLFGIAVLLVGFDKFAGTILKGAPITPEKLFPAIPLMSYFFIGMVSTTACSPSLEGKSYWIMQSLPIEKKTIYQGKMLFNLYFTVPFALFSTTCMIISGKVPALSAAIYLIEIVALCCFSTAWGLVCGIKYMKLDWENEVEVVKQGAAIIMYIMPNMIVCTGLLVGVVALGFKLNSDIISLIITGIAALLAVLSYFRAMKLAEKTP